MTGEDRGHVVRQDETVCSAAFHHFPPDSGVDTRNLGADHRLADGRSVDFP